ncbi:MAG TPA: NAD(P)-binding protein [Thermoanaerobaculaceae bacterium]|nr:NAD(P)-binding protein [Thermoanaerobaculaceae bacterium]
MAQHIDIAGGGVSGLATAVLLARDGFAVEVWDHHVGGGGRFAGGWQVLENGTGELDALEELRALGLVPDFPVVPARRALFFDGFGRRHEVASADPFAYFVRRGGGGESLDAWLRRLASGAGVVVHEGMAAPPTAEVVATGPSQADGAAREVVFGSDLPDTVAVLFDPKITPTGYSYLFCIGGHATFGVAQVRSVDRLRDAQREAWARFRSAFGEFAVRNEHEGGQFMNFCLTRHLQARDGRWYVGEAAGVQDFLYGLGNRFALRSAGLVAAGVAGRWEQARFERTLARPMRTTVALRFAYERLGRRGFAGFCRVASRTDFRRLLLRLQRPEPIKGAIAAVVMAAWRERHGCRHAPVCTWCRRREH